MNLFEKYYIKDIDKKVAKKMIIDNHYSHQCSQTKIALGLFERGKDNCFFNLTNDKCIGCLIYNTPVGRDVWCSISTSLKIGEVLELTRLWIQDDTPKNIESWAISQSFDWLRKNKPEIKALISYADPSVGHKGTIYQATNWLFQRMSKDDDFFHKNLYYYSFDCCKSWIHQKTIFDRYECGGFYDLKKVLPKPFWCKKIAKKHRYIYILANKKEKKEILKTLKHPIQPYPKTIETVNNVIVKVE